jgi:UDP-N-acetylglucosamine 2-epimerase (non-hydrolysing)
MKTFKILTIFGTRPEAIKVGPVLHELQNYREEIETCVVVTGQHRSMLDQILNIFRIEPNYDLNIMKHRQSLSGITVRALQGLEPILESEKPDLVLVQGDTTTAFVGALTAYYHKIPVGHIEAGLRTRDKYNPYPEEINRHFIDVLADLCFAPTCTAKEALLAEDVSSDKIFITGNTVIDALLATVRESYEFKSLELRQVDFSSKTLLVTAHRRENHGAPLTEICLALRELLTVRKDLQLIFPVHLNPQVRGKVLPMLAGMDRVCLTDPLDYPDFVNLMARVCMILTDSGGIQEEAPTLGKPVLVMRSTTERPEAVAAGTARLVGTARQDIVDAVSQLLDNPEEYQRMAHAVNPYGDGHAAGRTVHALRFYFGLTAEPPAAFQMDRVLAARGCPPTVSELYEKPLPTQSPLAEMFQQSHKLVDYEGRDIE